jgi:hypothetical protein
MAASETLYQIIDKKYPNNNKYFGPAYAADEQFPQSRRPTAVTIPFMNGEYDPFGDTEWTLAGRDITFKFTHVYDVAAGENFTKVLDDYAKLIMCGRALTIVTQTSLSPTTYRYSEGKGVSMPRTAAEDFINHCVIEATIHMTQPLSKDVTPAGWSTWDQVSPALTWGQSGLFWDFNPNDFAMTTANIGHNITNNGTADELSLRIILTTPDVGGTFPAGYFSAANYNALSRAGNPVYFILLLPAGMGPGESYTVNCGSWSVRKTKGPNAGPAPSLLILPTGQDEIFRLVTGFNALGFSGTGVGTYNARVTIVWDQWYY